MEFVKFQCLGNDYIVVEEVNNIDYSKLAIQLCNRSIGIGALALIVISCDYSKYTYYDNNGIIINRIGSGLLEFLEYVKYKNVKLKNKVKFITGYFELEALPNNDVISIKVSEPIYKNQILGIGDNIASFGRLLTIENMHYTIYSLYLGEVYTIIFVDDFNNFICNNADLIANNKLFRKKTNVCFVKKIDSNTLKVKVYDYLNQYKEFSILSAAACAVVGKKLEIISNDVDVQYDYGYINVTIDKKERISINGKSNLVFTGKLGDELYD